MSTVKRYEEVTPYARMTIADDSYSDESYNSFYVQADEYGRLESRFSNLKESGYIKIFSNDRYFVKSITEIANQLARNLIAQPSPPKHTSVSGAFTHDYFNTPPHNKQLLVTVAIRDNLISILTDKIINGNEYEVIGVSLQFWKRISRIIEMWE